MKQIYLEAVSSIDSAAEGALMSLTSDHSKAPGVQDVQKLIKVIADLKRKTSQSSVEPKQLAQTAVQQGINPQAVVQFCDAVYDEPDNFGGFGHETLDKLRKVFAGPNNQERNPFAA